MAALKIVSRAGSVRSCPSTVVLLPPLHAPFRDGMLIRVKKKWGTHHREAGSG